MPLRREANEWVSEQAYLEGELTNEVKHEYIDGHIYAMSGASENHNLISQNISREFGNCLKQQQSPCKVFSSDMKVRISNQQTGYFYPDVAVVCDKHKDDDIYYKHSPIIIVEVLSKSTRKHDKSTKMLNYLNIPSLQEYALIEQDLCEIEVLKKSEHWKSTFYFLGDSITFDAIGVTLSVEDIYYQVDNDDIKLASK